MNIKPIVLATFLVFLSACSTMLTGNTNKNTRSSSLMEFLYPDAQSRAAHTASIPTLKLPVRVGLAFVPSKDWRNQGMHSNTQIELLDKVKASFVQYDFIDHIEVIPSTYLATGNGFETLEQVARLYDVDVMALVSYDQITQSEENNAALLYWTIVGMYMIPGNENSVQTFVDTAVFDVKSRKMLFRAPGLNKLEKRTTAIGVTATLSEKSNESFQFAVDDMIGNLDEELSNFKVRVKEEKIANVEHRSGYGGAIPLGQMLFLFLVFFSKFLLSRSKKYDD